MEFSAERIEKFKWPVSVSQKIQASPQKIWSVITKPGNLEDCHPFCERNTVFEWPGVGSKDVIYYYSGWILHREIVNWIDGMGYDLVIGRENGRKSYVSWRITGEQEEAQLRITIYPHALQHIPVAIRWIPHAAIVYPALHSYLRSVVKGFEWFITTETPVSKNQFGSHRWFSNNESQNG